MTAGTIGGVTVRGARGDYRSAADGWKVCTRCGVEWRGSAKAKSGECSSCKAARASDARVGVPCESPELSVKKASRAGCGCERCFSYRAEPYARRAARRRADARACGRVVS